ncbi:WD_REPEATS_REGION domain-containing protein, partial [Entomortierella chlamydospora]
MPHGSLLLDRIQNEPDVKASLLQVKHERLEEYNPDVYISLRARANKGEAETHDLRSRVLDFLNSDKKVFLILGDSGAGKSTFNKALEIYLWQQYNKGDRKIPLFIHLPSIKDLERDLVVERLRQANFTESQIWELKQNHEFILICDGYDECQQTRNL